MNGTSGTATERFGADAEVSQLRGRLFEGVCLGATLFALALMLVFLLYVTNDALRPFSADPGWLLTFAATVVVPALALASHYYRRDARAGEVAYTSLGLPIAATLLAGGVTIVFRHVVTPHEWLALTIAVVVSTAAIELHARVRSADALERLAVTTVVPLLAIVGVPSIDGGLLSGPKLVPSLGDAVLTLPILPTDALSLLLSFTLPIAALAARYVRNARERDRDAAIVAGGTVVAAAAGLALAPTVGLAPTAWILLVTVAGVPVVLYVEFVLRRSDGASGLAFPAIVALGAVLGAVLVRTFGFAGPDPWLTWEFLTVPHSRTPTDAGVYPPLVGSVMMLVVVAVSAFPVGVGAAVYLEEYAPNRGLAGTLVELVEINVANLAGVPSVVYGVLGLALFVRTAGLRSGIVLVGGLTIGLLVLPIVIVSSQEAIRAVPDSMRQASYGMGATKWQTTRNVVLPEALPGIMTGTILSLGRAIGETAPLLMIGAAAVVRVPPDSFLSKFSALPRQIFTWSRLIEHDFRYGVLAAGVLTLLVVLLLMNASAILVRNRYQRGN